MRADVQQLAGDTRGATTLMLIYRTDRLIVRMYIPDDAPFVFDMYSRSEVQQFLGPSPRPHDTIEMAPLSADAQPLPLSDDYEVGWHLGMQHLGLSDRYYSMQAELYRASSPVDR